MQNEIAIDKNEQNQTKPKEKKTIKPQRNQISERNETQVKEKFR